MRRLDFDLLRQKKIICGGREYPVREKTVRDEMGIVRHFRARFRDITRRSLEIGKEDYDAARACKHEELELMTEVIRAFCDVDRDTLLAMPIRPFYAALGYVLGGGEETEALDADRYGVSGTFVDGGVEHQIKAVSVTGALRMFEIVDTRLRPAMRAGDTAGEQEALVDIVALCVPQDRDAICGFPAEGVKWIADTILADANGGSDEGDEKNA